MSIAPIGRWQHQGQSGLIWLVTVDERDAAAIYQLSESEYQVGCLRPTYPTLAAATEAAEKWHEKHKDQPQWQERKSTAGRRR